MSSTLWMSDHFMCADCDTVCASEFKWKESAICIDCASVDRLSIGGDQ